MKSTISMNNQSARARIKGAVSLALLCFVTHSSSLAAQLLGAIPPLPPVVVTRTDDGLTAKIGDETLRVSVCSTSVVHVVATPRSPESIRHDQLWVLAPKQSCPGRPIPILTG